MKIWVMTDEKLGELATEMSVFVHQTGVVDYEDFEEMMWGAMTEVDLDELKRGGSSYPCAMKEGYERACKDILAHIKEGV